MHNTLVKEIHEVKLLQEKKIVQEKLRARIEKGQEFIDKELSCSSDFIQLKIDIERWDIYNKKMLFHMFSTEEVLNDYNNFYTDFFLNETYFDTEREFIRNKVSFLLGIEEQLEFYSVESSVQTNTSARIINPNNRDVFIVHGQDHGAKNSVARLLQNLELKPIILHEQVNEGRTIIEKFEEHSEVGFAVVLLTPDDHCSSKEDPSDKLNRARQNVILELGYFLAKLGRKRVCILYKDGVELPSDMNGLLYVRYDASEKWRLDLVKEIRNAKIPVDLNKM